MSLGRMVFIRFWLDMRRRLTLRFVDNLSRQGLRADPILSYQVITNLSSYEQHRANNHWGSSYWINNIAVCILYFSEQIIPQAAR